MIAVSTARAVALAVTTVTVFGAGLGSSASVSVTGVASDPGGVGSAGILYGVSTLAPTDAWAVGSGSRSHPLVEHFDGSSWTRVSSPPGRIYSQLFSVDANSASDVWAVGIDGPNEVDPRTLIMHWDGTEWSRVPSPTPTGSDVPTLSGVSAMAADDVWAVGSYSKSGPRRTLVEHWNGSEWIVVPSPNRGRSEDVLTSVTAITPTDVWAVGDSQFDHATLVEHWDGSEWSIVSSPNGTRTYNDLRAVSATSASDVWAVGSTLGKDGLAGTAPGAGNATANGRSRTLIEHWDGKAWSIVSSPHLGSGYRWLAGVTAVSTTDAWAVGGSDADKNLCLHWDGVTWAKAACPSASKGSGLLGVSASSPTNADAVGSAYGSGGGFHSRSWTQHWDGTAWR